MVRCLIIILAVALGLTSQAVAQTDDDFSNELSYGINFNSNGGLIGGVFIRSSHFKRERLYRFWAVEMVEVKHPKETRWYSINTGDFFIYGKQNYLYVVRPQYGVEYTLFRKAAESGVQVNAVGAIGPSLGLQVPYYIRYNYSQGGVEDVRTEQYNPVIHGDRNSIYGSSNVFTGLGETSLTTGLHFKAGLSFEYGRYRENVTGIEVGFLVEHYFKRPVIIPDAQNLNTFPSVYLNIYYGTRK
ncbi:hypothetical protein [Pontibacter beigongshangensis]|uniref:hypothetical protein n=1 Tax=Pontibacter beigongshangensis TaxID=2574733 RepID=UPI00293BFA02|nr:hypothetical protein [Pontibacter beigongshangensis]